MNPDEKTPVQPSGDRPKMFGLTTDRVKDIIIVILVFMLAIGGVFFYDFKNTSDQQAINPAPTPTPMPTPEPPTVPDYHIPDDNIINEWITVKWSPTLIKQTDNCIRTSGSSEPVCDQSVVNFKVGVIADGTFAGKDLFLSQQRGMGTFYEHYLFDEGKQVTLDTANIGIRGIDDMPESIDFPIKEGYILKKGNISGELFEDQKKIRKLFSHPLYGDFYLSDDGCVIVMLPDHTAIAYDFDYDFINIENGEINVSVNGTRITDPYDSRVPACIADCYYWNFATENFTDQEKIRYQLIGETATREDLWALKDPNDPRLKEVYGDKYTVAYYTDDYQQTEKSKYTYEQFLALNPLLFWQDPLGRLVEFRNRKVATAAEMCKPVIYLYPETIQHVNVKVSPNGGFTKTEPNYGNGWDVIASPSGKLLDLGSGGTYDYLFWEGLGLSYPREKTGWVVKQQDIPQFLSNILPKLGLNDKEIADFQEYWNARLTNKPYYHIAFVNKAAFDEIAPLSVSGDPDSIIRVMMTAHGLDQHAEMEPQNLDRTPVRTGFTVVEWGGAVFDNE